MPYVITTINDCASCDERRPGAPGAGGATHLCAGCGGSDGRTAVATLEEVVRTLNATGADWKLDGANGEGGGTIGPLPDGTVIEVARVDRFALGFSAGLIAADHPQLWADADLVAKFNRTGRFSADPA